MSTANYGLQDIKKELQHLSGLQIADLCLRLARHKKENKELLAYLLFESNNQADFVEKIKAEVGFMFSQLPVRSYEAAKYLRKILRLISKYIKFMASKEAEIELLLNFCAGYIQYADRKTSYKPLRLVLIRQIEKVRTAIGKLHEDLQMDFANEYGIMLDDAEKKLSWFNKSNYLL
jgi:hypothetical protein